MIQLGKPDEKDREEILQVITRQMPIEGVDLPMIAKETEGMSGRLW